MGSPASYANFPVQETVNIQTISDIDYAINRLVKFYLLYYEENNFSYRILLPKGEERSSRSAAKSFGFKLQNAFLRAIYKNKLKPNIKQVRYVHDESHYGWILASPMLINEFNL
jgi:hypothetical protein